MSISFSGNPASDTRWDAAYSQAEAIGEAECGWTGKDCVNFVPLDGADIPHDDVCDYCREVQRVADRVGIIRHGRLIAVEAVASLRSKGIRTVELFFDSLVDAAVFEPLPGVGDVTVQNHHVTLSFSGQMETLLRVVTERYTLLDISTQEADLEEIFLTYYRDDVNEVVA